MTAYDTKKANTQPNYAVGCSALLIGLAAHVVLLPVTFWCLWAWYVSTLGIPEISIVQAWGLSLLVNLLTFKGLPKQDEYINTSRMVAVAFSGPIFDLSVLMFGWLGTLFL